MECSQSLKREREREKERPMLAASTTSLGNSFVLPIDIMAIDGSYENDSCMPIGDEMVRGDCPPRMSSKEQTCRVRTAWLRFLNGSNTQY